jgi:hypothetical protein
MKKSATLRKEGLQFTYNLKKNLKIDLDRLKMLANEKRINKEEEEKGTFGYAFII